MKRIAILILCICALAAIAASASQPVGFEKNWHHWRGPHATGAAIEANPPTTWSETENIRWKVAIPGTGHAAPIVWEDKIFIQTAIKGEVQKAEAEESDGDDPFGGFFNQRRGQEGIKESYKFNLIAISRNDGSILWQKTLHEANPHEGKHQDGTYASNSPVTDGEHVYAYFGSRGLYCVDMMGNVKWEKDIGTMFKSNTFGEGSSPVLYGDNTLVMQFKIMRGNLLSRHSTSGQEMFYGRPTATKERHGRHLIVVEQDGKAQVITTGTKRVRSYDLETGELCMGG